MSHLVLGSTLKKIAALTAFGFACIGTAQAAPEAINIGPNGETVTLHPYSSQSISANGAVVFFHGEVTKSGGIPVLARDRQARSTQILTKTLGGQTANAYSLGDNSASADGRYVIFDSTDSNLVANDTNETRDVFLADRKTGLTSRVNVANDGTQAEASSNNRAGSISADGRYVTFISGSRNLDSSVADNGYILNIFVRDLVKGTTKRINVTSDNQNGSSLGGWPNFLFPKISADGRFVIFYSPHLLAPNGGVLYIRDQLAGTTSPLNIPASGDAQWALSANGRFVSYYNSNSSEIEVYDRQADSIEKLTTGNSTSGVGAPTSLSANGRYVTYRASSGTTNGTYYAMVYDRQTKTSAKLSNYGATGSNAAISGDGRHIVVENVVIANPLFQDDGFCSMYNPYISE